MFTIFGINCSPCDIQYHGIRIQFHISFFFRSFLQKDLKLSVHAEKTTIQTEWKKNTKFPFKCYYYVHKKLAGSKVIGMKNDSETIYYTHNSFWYNWWRFCSWTNWPIQLVVEREPKEKGLKVENGTFSYINEHVTFPQANIPTIDEDLV